MQCRIELFSLAHWQILLYNPLGIIFVLVSLDAHVVQVWCSTDAMAQYADVYAVDMKTMYFFFFFGGEGVG